MDADDIVASEIGDIYEARRLLNTIKDNPDDDNITKFEDNKGYKAIRKFYSQVYGNTTTERVRLATPSPSERLAVNQTVRDIRRRILMRQLDKILNTDYKYISNFNVEEDHLTILTQKFDKLVEEHKAKANQTRREVYWDGDNQPRIWLQKLRSLNLMSQFIYMTRYKLVYSQILRKKYVNNYRYRLGYLFALLRNVKNMQKWVYSALKNNEIKIDTINFHVKCFERIMRFDIDIKDLIKFIIKTEYLRNMEYNPKFYDYSMEQK